MPDPTRSIQARREGASPNIGVRVIQLGGDKAITEGDEIMEELEGKIIGSPAALLGRLLVVVLLFGLFACALPRPTYPPLGEGTSACVLRFDNRDPWYHSWSNGTSIRVELDGFAVTQGALPNGVTELKVASGSHVLKVDPHLYNAHWTLTPTEHPFDCAAGRTYTIRFIREGVWIAQKKTGYRMEYDGWNSEEQARWPQENRIANWFW